MHIELGKIYDNKTWNYLTPILRMYGEVFTQKFNNVFKLAIGVHDTYLDGSTVSNGRNLYVMIDNMHRPKLVEEFKDYIMYQDFYKGEYTPDVSSLAARRKQIIILSIPQDYYNAYDMFLKGKYSQMYTNQQIEELFERPHQSYARNVFRASTALLPKFIRDVNTEFNTSITEFDDIHYEVELPPKADEEIFHFTGDKSSFIESESILTNYTTI